MLFLVDVSNSSYQVGNEDLVGVYLIARFGDLEDPLRYLSAHVIGVNYVAPLVNQLLFSKGRNHLFSAHLKVGFFEARFDHHVLVVFFIRQ